MYSSRLLLGLLLGGWLLTACQPTATDLQPEPDPTTPATGTPTEVGKPVGNSIQKTIGPAGGSLSTADGTMTLIIPAGALNEDTPITVQPVENKAPGGTGLGYDLSPNNLELAKPAELVWNYQDKDMQGSAPEALGIAVQQPDRTWLGRRDLTLNRASRRIAARLSKLQPAAYYEQFFMRPDEASIAPGETQQLSVFFMPGRRDNEMYDVLAEPVLLKGPVLKNWRVNGQDLNNRADPQLGSLSARDGEASATYLAPTRIPKQNQIAVSVEVAPMGATAKLILVSNLTVEGVNNFKINGNVVDTAEVITFAVADGQLFQVGLAEGLNKGDKQATVVLTIGSAFSRGGNYMVDNSEQVQVSGKDRNRKYWSSSYVPRGGKKVYGPLQVLITDYDPQKKRVAGKFSGTLHHYDERTDKHETTTVSASFRATSLL